MEELLCTRWNCIPDNLALYCDISRLPLLADLSHPHFKMPKSKRDKKISLTRTEKKPGLETKAALVEKVRGAVDNYARIFVFQVHSI